MQEIPRVTSSDIEELALAHQRLLLDAPPVERSDDYRLEPAQPLSGAPEGNAPIHDTLSTHRVFNRVCAWIRQLVQTGRRPGFWPGRAERADPVAAQFTAPAHNLRATVETIPAPGQRRGQSRRQPKVHPRLGVAIVHWREFPDSGADDGDAADDAAPELRPRIRWPRPFRLAARPPRPVGVSGFRLDANCGVEAAS